MLFKERTCNLDLFSSSGVGSCLCSWVSARSRVPLQGSLGFCGVDWACMSPTWPHPLPKAPSSKARKAFCKPRPERPLKPGVSLQKPQAARARLHTTLYRAVVLSAEANRFYSILISRPLEALTKDLPMLVSTSNLSLAPESPDLG